MPGFASGTPGAAGASQQYATVLRPTGGDDVPQWLAAWNALNNAGGGRIICAGMHRLGSTLSLTGKNITIQGLSEQGHGFTDLNSTSNMAGDMLVLSGSGITLDTLSIRTEQTKTAGHGLRLNNLTQSTITGVGIYYGFYNGLGTYGGPLGGTYDSGPTFIEHVYVASSVSTALRVEGSVDQVISNSTFNGGSRASMLYTGTNTRQWTNLTYGSNGNAGLEISPTTPYSQNALFIDCSQFGTNTANWLNGAVGACVFIGAQACETHGNNLAGTAGSGFRFTADGSGNAPNGVTVANSWIVSNAYCGIELIAGSNIKISNNMIGGNGVAGYSGQGIGVWMPNQSTLNNIQIQNNAINTTMFGYTTGFSGNQAYGIVFPSSGIPTNTMVQNNNLSGNITAATLNGGGFMNVNANALGNILV